jgi:hypothetical protein
MTISNTQRELFTCNPDEYLLRLSKDGQITVEEKNIWTWLKANALFEDEYNLKKIVAVIKVNEAIHSVDFLKAIDLKVTKYNKNPRHTEKIESFPRLKEVSKAIDEQAKKERLKGCQIDSMKATSEKSPGIQFIEECVISHLKPYLDGTITPENENRDRESLLAAIVKKLKVKFPHRRFPIDAIGEVALAKYCHVAAWQFCVHQRQDRLDEMTRAVGIENVNQFEQKLFPMSVSKTMPYYQALEHSLPIDFPELKLTREAILKLAAQSLLAFLEEYNKPIVERNSDVPKG